MADILGGLNMHITLTHLIGTASIAVASVAVLMGLLMYFVKKSSVDNDRKINEHVEGEAKQEARLTEVLNKLNDNLEELNKEVHELKLDLSNNYVRKRDLEHFAADNKKSHKDQWDEVNDLKERVVVLETRATGNRRTRKK